MRVYYLILCLFLLSGSIHSLSAHYPHGVLYKVYQLPNDRIPTLDGDLSEWEIVPKDYIIDTSHLEDTEEGHGKNIPKDDLDVKVIVAWNDSTNRLYFMISMYDDFHNFDEVDVSVPGRDDIFEIVLDADHSGGNYHTHDDVDEEHQRRLFSAHAQNYHGYIPPRQGKWAWFWGAATWLEYLPYSDFGCQYDGPHGSAGLLTMELYITPYNYASHLGPEFSALHDMKEGDIMGISWSILDYDENDEKGYDGFYNLSHNSRMDRTADLLPNFELMPMEPSLKHLPRADFLAGPAAADSPKTITFFNKSSGEISETHWDFGDGTTSREKNPVHTYSSAGIYTVKLSVVNKTGKDTKVKTNYVRTF